MNPEAPAASSEPTLDDIAAAMKATDGRTPSAVLDAFVPVLVCHHGHRLVPLMAGHELLLGQFNHPLATGEKWDASDILMAFYIFTHPSTDLFQQVANETFEGEFFKFVHTLPAAATDGLAAILISHWMKNRNTALAMESAHGGSKKKAVGSAGSSPRWVLLARSLGGLLIRFFTRSRSPKCSP